MSTITVTRGALIKPRVFTEIKENRDWDTSAEAASEAASLLRLQRLRDLARLSCCQWYSRVCARVRVWCVDDDHHPKVGE